MGKTKDIASETAAQIVILSEQGAKQKEIANILKVNQSVVSRTLKRYKNTGKYSRNKPSGQPRCTSEQTDRMIHRMAVENPMCSASYIQANLPNEVNVSTRTIRRRLNKEFNLVSYSPAVKPLLSDKNVKDRLIFADKYKDWTADQWRSVMFSDESTIKQFSNYTSHVRRPPGQRYNPKYTVSSVKHSPSVMIWGCISAKQRGGLWFMPPNTTINSPVYLSILKEKLVTFMGINNCTYFQQDGAPCHTSRLVKRWLADNNINLLGPWPGSSPDLNPIENCWAILKKKVSKLKPTSLEDLKTKIINVWCQEITPDYCEKLVASMPDRINAVIKAKGHATKY